MATSLTPAAPPPPGVVPNFDDPSDTLLPHIIIASSLSIAITTLFTAARLTAKRTISRFSAEDWILLVVWAAFVAYNAVAIVQGYAGLGRHIWDVRATAAIRIAQLSWAIELLYCPLTWLAKVALLLQLQRTFVVAKKGAVYITIQTLIWTNFAFYFSSFFAILFECTPQARIWNPETPGHCIQTFDLLIAMGVINVISDIAILLLPIWAIWHLHMDTKVKLGISAIFATGMLAFASSICRLAYTVQSLWSDDATYVFACVLLWSLAEIASIILCTCFPMMPRFIQILMGRNKNGTAGRSYGSAGLSRPGHVGTERSQTARRRCQCKSGTPCPLHDSYGKLGIASEDDDEERLYIHKRVSVELTDHALSTPQAIHVRQEDTRR